MRGLTGILIGLTLVTASCRGASSEASASIPDHTVVFTSAAGERETLQVAVADDDPERAQGLMGVPSLPDGQGMAFVFEEPTNGSFWMKDTLIPLSIAFVDAGGTVIGVREMTPCETEPCPTYGVDGRYTMAVEANRDYFASEGIAAGDEATLEEMGT